MPRDFIKIDTTVTTATHAALLKSYVQSFRSTIELGIRLKAILDHNTDGTVYTDIEALCGIPTGKGAAVYNLVAGSVGAINGTVQSADGKTLTEQVG